MKKPSASWYEHSLNMFSVLIIAIFLTVIIQAISGFIQIDMNVFTPIFIGLSLAYCGQVIAGK